MTIVTVGEGRLTWPRHERVGDRYGAVMLAQEGNLDAHVRFNSSLSGSRGTLIAEVMDVRPSPHIGDLFRGLFPTTPQVGERIVLGTGTVFMDMSRDGADAIGLQPDDGRSTDWLDPEALYRAHWQTVSLELILEAVTS